jgi:hypothetical protein
MVSILYAASCATPITRRVIAAIQRITDSEIDTDYQAQNA